MLRKKELKVSPNLKQTFNLINNHLYAKLKYTDTDTRARSKAIVNLLLVKLVDEITKKPEEFLDFCIHDGESKESLLKRIQEFFICQVKTKYSEVFEENESININADLVYTIVNEIQNISLLNSSKDILSDAFEVFVSKVLKEEGGQFFTPPNIIRFMVEYLSPKEGCMVLDPACGHGGFLLGVKDFLWSKIKDNNRKINLISNLYGIDKDLFLARICKLYLDILSGGESNVFCEDSLDFINYRKEVKESIKDKSFDYILTNPPFGAKIPIDNKEVLKNYQLGHTWKNINRNHWKMQDTLVKRQPPQILFIERCVQLLKDGGKIGIVLPEGIFGNPTNRYIWEYLHKNGIILAIISLDQNTFQPYTCNKTSILFFQKLRAKPKDYTIDFAIVDNVGHDKDGKVLYKLNKDGSKLTNKDGEFIINDELQDLSFKLQNAEEFNYLKEQKLFKIKLSEIKNNIFIPTYYTGVEKTLRQLQDNKNFILYSIKDLANKGIIYTNKNGYLPRGDEIGSSVYGFGEVPFIRTSEIYNWEVNLNPNKKTSDEVYEQYKKKQNIEVGDILLVKDGGSNLIGNTAFITELDTKIIIQSHIYQIKTMENNQAIDSYLLLYLLNLDIVQKQIQAITFVQGTIATIGNRIMDVVLPFPHDLNKRSEISQYIAQIIKDKVKNRKKMKNLSIDSFNLKT
ncbi:MAG: N-6 DNA methylase [Promethearchaeota archaeon]